MVIALVGNQNCGKSTLFNRLTGANQHVGNFPGVTIEKKQGKIAGTDMTALDLPGTYSLVPYTPEEEVTKQYVLSGETEVILNIIDGTNIERGLFLTVQLLLLKKPIVVAVNMMDEVGKYGGAINITALSKMLGVPCVGISAGRGEGITELTERLKTPGISSAEPLGGPVKQALNKMNLPLHEAVLLACREQTDGENEQILRDMEKALSADRQALICDSIYSFIDGVCKRCVKKGKKTRVLDRRLDAFFTNRFTAVPAFALITAAVFYITFVFPGGLLVRLTTVAVSAGCQALSKWLVELGANEYLRSLAVDGLFAGIGSVLSFLPTVLVLFLLLSLLEDSGYMARIAFVMDIPMRKLGLSGKAIVPILMGLGCSVPAIMATRTLPERKGRMLAIMTVPFVSCSARLPVYAAVGAAIFGEKSVVIVALLYILGIFSALFTAKLFKNTPAFAHNEPFILELPPYRIPSPLSLMRCLCEKSKDFLRRAFSVIFFASAAVWFLRSFSTSLLLTADIDKSCLAFIAKLILPFFTPIGITSWQAAAALIAGISAKETVISTLSVLSGGTLLNVLSPRSALSFLCFTALYTPCAATISVMRKELGSKKVFAFSLFYQTAFAYAVSAAVYFIGGLI